MPIYEFQCDCGHRFEQILRVSSDTFACESCGDEASRLVSLASGASFAQRTGNEDIDVLVGEDAEKRWAVADARKESRDQVRKETGSERLTVSETGEVSPLSQQQLDLRKSVYSAYDTAKAENRVE